MKKLEKPTQKIILTHDEEISNDRVTESTNSCNVYLIFENLNFYKGALKSLIFKAPLSLKIFQHVSSCAETIMRIMIIAGINKFISILNV